ncbi:uncharacterized protein [Watersipora subatra]|uniref:uncharacterized protein isoform X2 n=1 Tax=Watersipora subatra TaxID=2589382 RepID=UPI00355B3D1D
MTVRFAGRVVLYSIVGCPHCKAAKFALHEKEIPFTDVSVDQFQASVRDQMEDPSKWAQLIEEVTNHPPPDGFPVVPEDSLRLSSSPSDSGVDFVCETDEEAKYIEAIRQSGIIKDHRKGIFKQRSTFTGNCLVHVFISCGLPFQEAIDKGRHLVDHHYIHRVKHDKKFTNDDSLYRLLEHDDSDALNQGEGQACGIPTVNQLGEDLRKLILKIYTNYLSDDGKKVDYAGIGHSSDFKTYRDMTTLLPKVRVEIASREEKLAFFINVYNALVIHANVERGPPAGLWQRYKFFNSVKYIIGGQPYSLQDIENGVLRANRKGVGMFFRPFYTNDPRLPVALEQHEPYIHFALVCGAKSCPPIKTYSADDVMNQLKMATQAFLEGDDVRVDVSKKTVALSKIFSWYKEDFGGSDVALLNWICSNMDESKKKADLQQLVSEGKTKVTFLPYDWSVNS